MMLDSSSSASSESDVVSFSSGESSSSLVLGYQYTGLYAGLEGLKGGESGGGGGMESSS